MPSGTEGISAVEADHIAAIAYREIGNFKQAQAAMERVLQSLQLVEQNLIQTRAALLQSCGALALADGAVQSERDFFDAARGAVNTALSADLPTPANIATARKELEKAAKIVARTGDLKDLHDRNPAAAASAHLAFEAMRAKTGGGEITPERIDAAEQAAAEARLEALRFDTEMRRAEALPIPNIDAGVARMQQIADARIAKEAAEVKAKEAADLANALIGTQMLTKALDSGPLSGKGSARKMPDAAIQALIAGYENHPRVTDTAVDIANSALDPVAVAQGVASVGAQVSGGFKSGDGTAPNGLEPMAYAEQILKMGGTCGADYFEKLDDYVRLGGLMDADPLPDSDGDTLSARAQKRSASVAGKLIDENGVLALGSDEAKLAVGHMMFHPDAMANPTPALNKHALDTLQLLGTDPDKTLAEGILANITPPPPGQGGAKLVNAALGKTGDPSDNDVRQAVLSSMMQSVDQGPVGSCFATAPARRLREDDPIEAMRKYTELAVDGTFTTAGGTKVPAVTNLPPGEDPLIRSMEYSLATAVGRDDSMRLQKRLSKDTLSASREMGTAMAGDFGSAAPIKAAMFLMAIKNEFSTMYDPMVVNSKVASDGSSTRGRYILIDSGGNEITTKQLYQDRAVEVALKATGYARDSEEGKTVIAAVENEYMAELSTKGAPPWELASGGMSEETMVALVPGATGTRNKCTEKLATEPSTASEIGARTQDILTGIVDNLGPGTSSTVAVDTAGMHDFSLLAGDDSMQDFLSGPGSTADKVQAKLVAPGQALASTALSPTEAQKAFDDIINPYIPGVTEDPRFEG